MAEAVDAMQRMTGRTQEPEGEQLKTKNSQRGDANPAQRLASRRNSSTARSENGQECWEAIRVRRNGNDVERLENRHELTYRSVSRGTRGINDDG